MTREDFEGLVVAALVGFGIGAAASALKAALASQGTGLALSRKIVPIGLALTQQYLARRDSEPVDSEYHDARPSCEEAKEIVELLRPNRLP